MSNLPDSGQSPGESPLPAFPLASRPVSAPGPETVVNPEGRGVAVPIAAGSSKPVSGIWKQLFPPDAEAGTAASPVDLAGLQLGHFVIEERIGIGGMGTVFRAVDRRLERVVALKVLAPAQSRDPAAVQRFQNEARAAAQLDDDNIARVHFIGEDQGLHFIAFEYVTGTNIRDLIRQHGRLHPSEAVNYTLQVAAALQHTSAAGVIHRDIKPSNVIITPKGRAKLVDLGLARKETSDSSSELTLAGTTLGTFDYISPEQAKDPRNVDVRSDIYSLGCTLYHMLTGEPPYPQGTVFQKLLDHQDKEPPDPAKKNRRVSDELSSVVRKMMASDPRRRYTTPDQLVRDLMLVAGSMGMRGVHPESLVWTSAKFGRSRFWERHFGWMATAVALLVIVFLLDRFPGIGQYKPDPHPSAESRNHDPAQNEFRPDTAAINRNPLPRESADPSGQSAATVDPRDQSERVPVDVPGGSDAPVAKSDGPAERMPEAAGPTSPKTPDRRNDESANDPKLFEGDVQRINTKIGSANSLTSGHDPQGPSKPKEPPSGSDLTVPDNERLPVATHDTNAEKPPAEIRPIPIGKEQPAISIIAKDGGEATSFPTLEAACAEAKDGNVIELSYNGRRPGLPERPFRIKNKKITIRAAEGFRPLVEFAVGENPTEDDIRIMTLIGGSVDLINLDLHLTVDEGVPVEPHDHWAMLSLQGSGRVHLRGVSVTIKNSGHRPATVVELIASPGGNPDKMKMMKTGQTGTQPNKEFEIKIKESFIRGGGNLVAVKHTQPGRFDIENSVVALQGSLLTVMGDLTMPAENSELELVLEHVTCLVGESLVRMDSGEVPRKMLPVHVSLAQDNILATNTDSPLIAMAGNTNADDFLDMLRWNGEKNFYDGFETFWSIQPNRGMMDFRSLDFDRWQQMWGSEVDASSGGIVWKQSWRETPFSQLTAADLALAEDAEGNPALKGATDGAAVGADLLRVPQLQQVPKLPPIPKSISDSLSIE